MPPLARLALRIRTSDWKNWDWKNCHRVVSVMMRCFVIAAAAVCGSAAATSVSAAPAETPLVPVISSFHHWDHHWYIWLPGDPVYEAVEVMIAEHDATTAPLVWVFFTERDGAKHQAHYYNDARFAAAVGRQYRDIAYTILGPHGGPRGLSLTLTDRLGRAVAIDVQCDPNTQLSTRGAGLTNQIGHSSDSMLLFFFREKNVFARTWQVMVGGTDLSKPQPGQNHAAPFAAVYSQNILVGSLPFRDQRISFGANAVQDVERFAAGSEPDTYQAQRPDRSLIELVAPQGGLVDYRHRDGAHTLDIAFEPPLKRNDATAGQDSSFRLSLDDFRDLATGTVHVGSDHDTTILDWHFQAPAWAQVHPLRSTFLKADPTSLVQLSRAQTGR